MALALTAAGLGVPCCAWYVAGSSAARARAAAILAQSPRDANLEAARLARQIALRLEALRESESRRSFQDYLSGDRLAEIVGGDCGTEDRLPSPLAEGPVDPMIRAHFQIDDVGIVTLPALGSGPRPAGATETDGIEQAVLGEIECASSTHLAALQRSVGGPSSRHLASPRGLVTVGPFSWHTVPIDGAASLVALREVSTPIAVLTQGFVVPTERLEALLDGSPFATTIRPGLPLGDGGASIPIQGDPWSVDVDFADAQASAAVEARAVRSRFHRSFSLGSLAALVAGASLVLLVRETERTGRERTRFAAAAAHELRTPLAGLQLYGDMLADGLGDPTKLRDYARRMSEEASRLGRVVSNVLGFSQLERGNLAVDVKPGPLGQALQELAERAEPALDRAGALLALDVSPDLQARFDRDAVFRIVGNLLDNAEKYGRAADDRTIELAARETQDHVEVTVRDHGPGISAEARAKLFRAFARGVDNDGPAGLGLGLALSKSLAEAMTGTLEYRDGVGATFVLTLPKA